MGFMIHKRNEQSYDLDLNAKPFQMSDSMIKGSITGHVIHKD